MSNLYKRNNIISKTERVIDYNEAIRNKIESLRKEIKSIDTDGFVGGLNADVVEALVKDDEMAATNEEELENQNSLKQHNIELATSEAQKIVSDAKEEAERIIHEASNEAEQMKQTAIQEGISQGRQHADEEINTKKAQLEQTYIEKEQQLVYEYEDKKAKIEPELVNTLMEVFKKITYTVSEDNHEIILNLINGVMHNTDNSKEFVIKVSPEDYKFLVSNQGKIYCAMSNDIQMDIVEDTAMTRSQCIIETEAGVYNCSLDVQLENLIKDIKLLSCL